MSAAIELPVMHPDLAEAACFLASVTNVSRYHQAAIAELTQFHIDAALRKVAANDPGMPKTLTPGERAIEARINAVLGRTIGQLRWTTPGQLPDSLPDVGHAGRIAAHRRAEGR